MDCSLPGSSVHGIFQARVLEWGASAFLLSIFPSIRVYSNESAVHIRQPKYWRNMQQMKEHGKSPPDQTDEEELGSLPEKEFRVMIVKMIQSLGIKMKIL